MFEGARAAGEGTGRIKFLRLFLSRSGDESVELLQLCASGENEVRIILIFPFIFFFFRIRNIEFNVS